MQQHGEINGVPVAFSNHALTRMVEMELTANQVKKLLLEPEQVYESRKYPDDICHRYGEHSMAICLDRESGRYVVRTVLYATKAAWLKAERDGMLGEGREDKKCSQFIPDF